MAKKKKKMKRKQAKSLSARNVIAIRKAAMKGVSTNAIAEKYGSTYGNIFSVIKNRSHTDVKVPGFLVWLKSQAKKKEKKSIPTGKRKGKKVKVAVVKAKEVTVAKRPKKEIAATPKRTRTIAVAPRAPKEIEVPATAPVPVEAAAPEVEKVPHMIPSVVVKRRKKPQVTTDAEAVEATAAEG